MTTTTRTQVFSKAETSFSPQIGARVVDVFDLFHGNNVKIAFAKPEKRFLMESPGTDV